MKGLLCTGQVIKNILDESQTQDRRPMMVQPDMSFFKSQCPADGRQWDERDAKWELGNDGWYLSIPGVSQGPFKAPSKVGDILYCRETWWAVEVNAVGVQCCVFEDEFEVDSLGGRIPDPPECRYLDRQDWQYGRHPNIHMPKIHARIFLEVTEAKPPERACDISEADALAEGIETYFDGHKMWYKNYLGDCDFCGYGGAIKSFQSMWELMYPGKWEYWVWPRTFKQVDKPERK